MSYNFDIYRKDSGNYLGSAEAFDPKTAAQQAILKSPLAINHTNPHEKSREIIALDENTFEILVAGEEYLVKKSVSDLAPQD
jgi:hypothetical protein